MDGTPENGIELCTPLRDFSSSECLLPGSHHLQSTSLVESKPAAIIHASISGQEEMDRRTQTETVPLLSQQRRRRGSFEEDPDEEKGIAGPQLDPELNEVLEKLLTPKSTFESLSMPYTDEPERDPEDTDRFDEDDFNEHRGFGGSSSVHAHTPVMPQYLKKKLGRRKSIPPSASHAARLDERKFTPEQRATIDSTPIFPHVLPSVSELTEPLEGEETPELVIPPRDVVSERDEFHGPPTHQRPRKAEFYFSAESLAVDMDSPPPSPRTIRENEHHYRRGSVGSHVGSHVHIPHQVSGSRPVISTDHHSPERAERTATNASMSRPPSEPNGEVRFLVGAMSHEDDLWLIKDKSLRKQFRSTPHFDFNYDMRRRAGSDVESTPRSLPTEQDEAANLQDSTLDNMWGHRMEPSKIGIRPKVRSVKSIIHPGQMKVQRPLRRAGTVGARRILPATKQYDHTPHEVYVEMEELIQEGDQLEWKEKARWIKYEEDVESGGKWGKPHAASLSFLSLLELRRCLERGTVLLDLEEHDIGSITTAVVDNMVLTGQIKPAQKWPVTRALLVKHRHMSEQPNRIRHSGSTLNLQSLINSLSFARSRTVNGSRMNASSGASLKDLEAAHAQARHRSLSQESAPEFPQSASMEFHKRKNSQIFRRIPKGAEASTVLVGALEFLEEPAVAFVRLAHAVHLHGFLEVDVPVRFIFVLLCPKNSIDYFEIGRSLATLMSNKDFHDNAYRANDKRDLLNAMNEFLADSIVLPPGHLDKPSLLPIAEIQKMNKNTEQRRKMSRKEPSPKDSPNRLGKRKYSTVPDDDLRRTGRLFGGLVNDVKRRFPWFGSDITDGLNFQCLASIFFIFFANLAPAITFGGILEDKVKQYMGVSEMLIASSLCGMLFSLLAAQPLTIIGATGPLLVFEYSLYKFCKSSGIEFMPFRIWIGLWVALLSVLVSAFDLGVLIRHVTRFTEEVFAVLIAFIFTFESLQRIYFVFTSHPLLTVDEYCTERNKTLALRMLNGSHVQNLSYLSAENTKSYTILQPWLATHHVNGSFDRAVHFDESVTEFTNEPNTALFCVILIIGTLFVATELRKFRNSKYLGRSVRRAIGDFGVPLAIVAMVVFDLLVPNVHTSKLDIPDGLTPTAPNKRSWFINPFGIKRPIYGWEIVAALIPAILVFILMYVEVQITCVLVNKKERRLKKGSGYHLDLVIVSWMTFGCSLFGLPWMCAATVQTISHVSSVSVYSRTHAPGEKPKLLEVREQRLTNFFCSLLIGLGVVFGAPALRLIPKAVVFGVFLYLGLSSISGVQFIDRVKLFFRPSKHHYDYSYVRKVRTWKMHAFTGIQLLCLLILIAVKSTDAALSFPFVLLLMVPLRRSLSRFYTKEELRELDNDECVEEKSDSEDEAEEEKGLVEDAPLPM